MNKILISSVLSVLCLISNSTNADMVGSLRPVYIESYRDATRCPNSDAYKLVSSSNQSKYKAVVRTTYNSPKSGTGSYVTEYVVLPLQQTFLGCHFDLYSFGTTNGYELINSYKIN